MKILRHALLFALTALPVAFASAAQPSLTIYNQNFAVVRERLTLDLKAGVNAVMFSGATVHLEPDSVVLRDPADKVVLRVLEQNYRADTISQGLLLSLNEGKELDFLTRDRDGKEFTVKGRVIRSGYTPNYGGGRQYGQDYYMAQQAMASNAGQPIIEVAGKLRFSLPGEPVFPALTDDAILKPLLAWQLAADRPAKFDAELSYVTGGMSWQASYNLVAPEKGDTLDVIGWVTIDNQSGKQFDAATIKLMAGNVNKIVQSAGGRGGLARSESMLDSLGQPVSEKAFDEFHLYTLPRATTLRDRETKQVEFIRATGVKTQTLYIYDGLAMNNYRGWDSTNIRSNPDYGTQSNKKIWVMREFKNTKENGLGLPLPAGRTRFYRRDDADNRLEFTGENTIEHTPQGETVRLYTGDAFDLVGERTRIDFQSDQRNRTATEKFEIKVRNRKREQVEIRVVEHLYRWTNWEITEKSDEFTKTDAQTVEFRVPLKPDEEKTVTYTVRYNWQ